MTNGDIRFAIQELVGNPLVYTVYNDNVPTVFMPVFPNTPDKLVQYPCFYPKTTTNRQWITMDSEAYEVTLEIEVRNLPGAVDEVLVSRLCQQIQDAVLNSSTLLPAVLTAGNLEPQQYENGDQYYTYSYSLSFTIY